MNIGSGTQLQYYDKRNSCGSRDCEIQARMQEIQNDSDDGVLNLVTKT